MSTRPTARTYLYAMSFLDAAPRWFGCFDQPDLKANFDIEVRCPTDWTVFGNRPARRLAAGTGNWRPPSRYPPTSSRWLPARTTR